MDPSESIVHEYSVLYSTRVFQKDKKWSDGTLKYYEFNDKLEIYNEDLNLISTDFYPKNRGNPIKDVFQEGNEFKLPNRQMVVEINEYKSSYKRDVSKVFKNHTKSSIVVPQEKISVARVTKLPAAKALLPLSGNNTLRRRRVGLTKPQTQLNVLKLSSNSTKLVESLMQYRPRCSERVLPRTSRHFQWLTADITSASTSLNNSAEPKRSPVKVKQEFKQEVDFHSGKSVQDADLIHDLSDFEDDEEFFEMLDQLKNNERAEYRNELM